MLAPTKIAGENIPPKNPKFNETAVAMILNNQMIINDDNAKLPPTISNTVFVPKPITSGVNAPIKAKTTIPTIILIKFIEIFCDSFANCNKTCM